MKIFKTERSWQDLERADKIALLVGVLFWMACSVGVYKESDKFAQLKQQAVKTEMVRGR